MQSIFLYQQLQYRQLLCAYNRWCQYIFVSVISIMAHLCSMCVCVCDFESEHQQKPCHSCQIFSKFDDLLHKLHSKVLLVLQCQGSKSLDAHIQSQQRSNKKSANGWGHWVTFGKGGVSNIEDLHKKCQLSSFRIIV